MQAKVDSKVRTDQDYQDYVPRMEIVEEDDCDILMIYLPGFKKDQLRVQLTQTPTLKISGERPIEGNKWSRFQKEYPVSKNCIKNKITAKFDAGILYIQQPKLITPMAKKDEEKPANDTQSSQKSEPEPSLAQNTKTENGSEQIDDTMRGDMAEEVDAGNALQKSQEEKGKEEQEKCDVQNDGKGKRKRGDEFLNEDFINGRVKMSKNVERTMNVVVVVLTAVLVGICVKNLITPASNCEN